MSNPGNSTNVLRAINKTLGQNGDIIKGTNIDISKTTPIPNTWESEGYVGGFGPPSYPDTEGVLKEKIAWSRPDQPAVMPRRGTMGANPVEGKSGA